MYLKLAWRNIWRNRRRTIITISAIFFAVFLSVMQRSMKVGSIERTIDQMVGAFLGHIQVHQKGYWDEQNLDNSFANSPTLLQTIKQTPGVAQVIPRLDSYALVAGLERSRAGLIMGIDPIAEKQLSNPEKKLVKGKYLAKANEEALLIAQGLAQYLKVQMGDSLVLLGQGFQGQSATGKYLVKGIIKMPDPKLNKALVYLPIKTAQSLFATESRLTTYCIRLDNAKNLTRVRASLQQNLAETPPKGVAYEVISWKTMAPELVQMMEADKQAGKIMLGVFYMILGFGILGTVLMMTSERRYEFGVLIGIGMKRFKLGILVFFEMLMLAGIGVILGIVVSLPIAWYLHLNPIWLTGDMAKAMEGYGMEPIIPFSVDPAIFSTQAIIVFVLTMIISIYPMVHTKRLNVMEALHG
ncbi:ABC transporter permease [Microscilla marina]|uniref:Transporter n=1 Tax=Microscilla marina ATCC 23134 TaxID=313606 RepID=A1ZTN1_MICM2|nr:FtsX-like permease family protein [Microscilla marina]EAY26291.1 transporter [Microscilla marina ATCC 23134]